MWKECAHLPMTSSSQLPSFRVGTCSSRHTDGAIVAGEFALGACAVELNTTDAAHIVFGHVPPPRGHGVVRDNVDLHLLVRCSLFCRKRVLGVRFEQAQVYHRTCRSCAAASKDDLHCRASAKKTLTARVAQQRTILRSLLAFMRYYERNAWRAFLIVQLYNYTAVRLCSCVAVCTIVQLCSCVTM